MFLNDGYSRVYNPHAQTDWSDAPKKKYGIEVQFLPGMTWKNYGAWQIDHMLPWEQFNLLGECEHPKVMHYTNLQPLWKADNNSKHSTIIYDMQWRQNTWYIHTGTEYACCKIQVKNKIDISVKVITGSFQGFAHVFASI